MPEHNLDRVNLHLSGRNKHPKPTRLSSRLSPCGGGGKLHIQEKREALPPTAKRKVQPGPPTRYTSPQANILFYVGLLSL